ncbi:MAG: carboxypeptidase regulatory-like domain-containing protein [Vicinamibacterales bacterium]
MNVLRRSGVARAARTAIAALIVLVLMTTAAFAQDAGSISGTVKDQSGAALPGATVTASNVALAVSQTVQSGSEGAFVFPLLPPGTYTVIAELSGFKKASKLNVILPTASKVSAGDFTLEIGSVTEVVSVEADAGRLQIQTQSGERSDLVTNRQLRDIALNGRNIADLMKLVPGVIAAGTITTSTVTNVVGQFNINGTRSSQHEYTIDGVTNLNLGNNTGGLVSVNPDALEEVKVLTSNYQAEYGRAGGGFIALTTRGGSSQYRGGLRYFGRNEGLNANTYFNEARGGAAAGFPKPLYRFNYYGWDYGGPVPGFGTRSNPRMFFFAAQEYYDQLVPQTASVNIRVPTELERVGNFSQTVDGAGRAIPIIDPQTGQPFPGNIIPSNRIYAPGLAVLGFLPTPNTTAGGNAYNYSSQRPSKYPRREDILRMDWQISNSTRLSARWVHNYDAQQFAYGTTTASWNFPLTVTERRNGPGTTLSFTLSKTLSSTLFNEFVFGAGRGGVTIAPADDKATRAVTGVNTPMLFPEANVGNLIPSLAFNGIASVPTVVNTSVFGPFVQRFVINNFIDNLTKVAGNHTFKVGVYYQRASNRSNSQTNVESNLDFSSLASNPLNTGYPFANALLGVYTGYTQASSKPVASYYYYDLSAYGQDTWKVAHNLTLDLGFRLSHYEPYYNSIGQGAYFDPTLYDPARAPRLYRAVCVAQPCTGNNLRARDPAGSGPATVGNTLGSFFVGKLVANTGDLTNGMGLTEKGYLRGGIKGQAVLPQPRLGLSWDVNNDHRMVVRGGFGIAFDRYQSGAGVGSGATNQPFVFNPTLTNGFLQDITSGGGGALAPQAVQGVDPDGQWPTVYSYSVGLQRELWKDTVVDVAYVGSQSRHNTRRENLNVLPYGTTFTAAAQDPTKTAGVVPAVEVGLPSIYSSAGLAFSGANALAIDFLRPYQGYSDITYYRFDGQTAYNSLQASLQRRFSKSLTFGLSYTLSRAVTTVSDDGTFTNNLNAEAFDRGLAAFDRTHYMTVNYVWNVPRGSGLLGGGIIARGLLDNWTLSGVSWLASGTPAELALTISGQDAGNRLLGTYTAGNGAGLQPRFYVNGAPQSAPDAINVGAFTVPTVGDRGPYTRAYLRNPGFQNHDLSVFKNFPLGTSSRRYLQFRVEAFNVFNITQFTTVNRTTNLTNAAGQTGAAVFNNYTGLTVTNNTRPAGSTAVQGTFFGEYTGTRDPRILQVGVKAYF